MNRSSANFRARGSAVLGMGGALFMVSAGVLIGYFVQVKSAAAGSELSKLAQPHAAVSAKTGEVEGKVSTFLEGNITLRFDGKTRLVGWKDLGASIDREQIGAAHLDDRGELSGFVPVNLDRKVATELLLGLKKQLDRPAQNARMDLEKRVIHPEVRGLGLDVFGAVSEIESAGRRGATQVELPSAPVAPPVTVETLGIDDISHVLAAFTTKFSVAEKSRNDNLKLVASRVDGTVMKPGQTFSFNEVVGDRTEKEGYKTAHVIEAGEMVDGMAGGACQISTTLHGAAFFAGLDIISSTPHSRPSVYVQMGLDATVVYPSVDLKLRNSYDFPVVIHYVVARGEARVEILGKERPYDRIVFERDVKKQLPFETITREDDTIAIGHMVTDQPGFPGYNIARKRLFYKNGKVTREDKWNVQYQPVVEYVRVGVNTDPNLSPPKEKESHMPKPAAGTFRMQQ
jgi:vancomycin resistance protein YoaR